jgi:hypothetical protein
MAQPKPPVEQAPSAQPKRSLLPLGMIKRAIDKGSVAGKLRDRKHSLDDKIKEAGG